MRSLTLAGLLLCGAAARAQAPEAPPPAEPDAALKQQWEERFRRADRDYSRSLDRAEAEAGLPKVLFRHFDAIDLDRDAQITPEELWAMHLREVAQREARRAARVGGPPR